MLLDNQLVVSISRSIFYYFKLRLLYSCERSYHFFPYAIVLFCLSQIIQYSFFEKRDHSVRYLVTLYEQNNSHRLTIPQSKLGRPSPYPISYVLQLEGKCSRPLLWTWRNSNTFLLFLCFLLFLFFSLLLVLLIFFLTL